MGKTQILGSLVNTILTDSSNNVGIGGAANASYKLQVTGTTNLTGALSGTSATFSDVVNLASTGNQTKISWLGYNNSYTKITSDVGYDATYNGTYINNNTNAAGNAQGNTAIPSWTLALGGEDSFKIKRSAAGSFTFSTLFNIASTGAATFNGVGTEAVLNLTADTTGNASFNYISSQASGGTAMWQIGGGGAVDTMVLYTANTPRMRITSGGVVGIGVTPASQSGGAYAGSTEMAGILRIQGSGRYFTSGDGMEISKTSIYSYNRSTGSYNTIGINDAMTIVGGGNVGIGTNNPTNFGAANTALTINGAGGNAGLLCLQANGADGMVVYSDGNGTTNYESRNLYMRFGTNNTERMRITSGGEIVMGRTTGSGGRLTVDGNFYLHNISSGAGQSTLKYNYTSTGLVTYDTSSRLLKKDIENLGYGLDDVLKMSAKKYKWKRDDSIDLGFIADEMVEIIPEIVFFSTEMTNETTGVPIGEPLSINYDRLIPVLVKAIQEQTQLITELEARIKQLENK